MKITFDCHDLDELEEAAEILINYFRDSHIFSFSGEMGAGKTTFIRAICRELGSADAVRSPTYGLVNEYSSRDGKSIYHFDFYRINDISEAIDIGLEEYLHSGDYCLIEWPEKIPGLLPPATVAVNILHKDEGRLITMEGKKDMQKA